jgi:hypothetical protein
MEVTTADKFQALVRTFGEPKFYLTLGANILVSALTGRSEKPALEKVTRQSSMLGRLGLVLHWTALLIAAVLFGLGCFVLVTAPAVNENTMVFVAMWWVPAIIVWLIGKAARFILTPQ